MGRRDEGEEYITKVTAEGARVESIDVKGKFIMPGLIDTHVHYSQVAF